MAKPLAERISNGSELGPESGCWIWRKAIMRTGYGAINHAGQTKYAHRAAYEAFIGPIPRNHEVRHLCGQRRCVNPGHLHLFRVYRGPAECDFDERYMAEPNSGCWLWIGAVNPAGYGIIAVAGSARLAHRISWEIHRSEIPDGKHVCHKCDVPCCVNPDHLFLGTDADNMADKTNKGRQHWGERTPGSTLKEADVHAIRASAGTHKSIGARFDVTQGHVTNIKNRKVWRNLQQKEY